MIVVMSPQATEKDLDNVIKKIESLDLRTHLSKGAERTIVGIIGDKKKIANLEMEMMDGVEKAVRITEKYKMVSREFDPVSTVIDVDGVKIGGTELVVMAGPCSVENREQLFESARAVRKCGAKILRGGAFKPRTSPYDFQGLGEEGLKLLREAADEFGMKVITEIVEEYIMSGGNEQVIFCERGIRTFETFTRNTLDLSAVAAIKELSHFPIIVDPSHGTGRRKMISPMSKAAIAAGADGLMIEVHPHPEVALSDGNQSLTPADFELLMADIDAIANAVGRTLDR